MNNNLSELFSTLKITKEYTISDLQARSVVNRGGSYRKTITEFINAIKTQQPPNIDGTQPKFADFHKALILETINLLADGGFQKLINRMKEVTRLLNMFNFKYNIVWYSFFKERSTQF